MEKDLMVVLMEIRTVVSEAMELHFGLGEAMNRIEKSLLALLSVPVEKGKLICRNCGTEKIIRNSLGENDCACGQQDMTTVKENNIVEWPKKSKTVPSIPEGHLGICGCGACRFVNDLISKNELIDQCLLAHNSIIAEKEKEIAELKEYKERIEPFMEELVLLSDGKDVVSDDQLLKEVIDKLKSKDSEIAESHDLNTSQAKKISELNTEIARLRRALQEIVTFMQNTGLSYGECCIIASRALEGE